MDTGPGFGFSGGAVVVVSETGVVASRGSALRALLGFLLGVAESALTGCGRPVCETCVRHGGGLAPSLDCWCDCGAGQGSLWLRLAAAGPPGTIAAGFGAFGTTTRAGVCPSGMTELSMQVGVMRCVAMAAEGVDCASLTGEALAAIEDYECLRAALSCARLPPPLRRVFDGVTVGGWTPLGPSGGCAGGMLTVGARGNLDAPYEEPATLGTPPTL